MLEPYADEVRRLKAENEALLRRVAALEARPDPFDVRKYIDERVREIELRAEAPSADDVAMAISPNALYKALDHFNIDEKIQEAVGEWCCQQDWTCEATAAFKEWAEENGLESDISEKVMRRIKVSFDEE